MKTLTIVLILLAMFFWKAIKALIGLAIFIWMCIACIVGTYHMCKWLRKQWTKFWTKHNDFPSY